MSSQETQTAKTTATPWEGQQPFLTTGFQHATNNLMNPVSQVAPFSPEQTMAQQATAARAINGSPTNAAANTQLQSTLNNGYLGGVNGQGGPSNPYLTNAYNYATQPVIDQFNHQIMPQITSQAESAGRYGSGAMEDLQNQAVNDLQRNLLGTGAQMSYQNYNDERTRQMQAAGLAPNQALQDYVDTSALQQVGQQQQDLANQQLMEPQQRLAQYMAAIQGNYGGTTTQQTPYSNNWGAQIVGGALGGLNTASQLGLFGHF